jgi:hypothetical protein
MLLKFQASLLHALKNIAMYYSSLVDRNTAHFYYCWIIYLQKNKPIFETS